MSFSIATNLLSTVASHQLDQRQAALTTDVARLSSGLRVNSAADDPSGLAIATRLATQVNAYTQAGQNVQIATNAASVADGALQSLTDLLQRIRTLAVAAASDITSASDKASLQTEVSQLLLEINRISQNTTFNGVALLDGSHSGFTTGRPPTISIQENAALAQSGPGYLIVSNGVVPTPPSITNGDFATSPAIPPGNVSTKFPPPGWSWNESGSNLLTYSGANFGFLPPLPAPPSASGQAVLLEQSGAQLTQTLTTLEAGGQYSISFDAATVGTTAGESLTVLANGTPIGSFVPGSGFSTFSTSSFTANGTSDTISFQYNGPTNASFAVTNVGITQTQLAGTPVAANTGLLVASAAAANSSFFTSFGGTAGLGGTGTTDGTIEIQVINTGVSIAAQETYYDSATGLASVSSTLLSALSLTSLFDNVEIGTGDFTAADVGATAYLRITQNVPGQSNPNNPALTIHDGASEGDIISIDLPAVNTDALRISAINLLISTASSPSIGAEDAIGAIDDALSSLLLQRAQLGAVVVRLNETLDDNNVSGVNLQAAESNIVDLNVGNATTAFTRDKILASVGTSILAQANNENELVLGLLH